MIWLWSPRVFGYKFGFSVSPPTDEHENYRAIGIVSNRAWVQTFGYMSHERALDVFKNRAMQLVSVFDPTMQIKLQCFDFHSQTWLDTGNKFSVNIVPVAVLSDE
jgi:hypothetical protein